MIAVRGRVSSFLNLLVRHLLAVEVQLDFGGGNKDVELVEASMEDSLHLIIVKSDPLDLPPRILVIIRYSLARRIDGDPDFRLVVLGGHLPDVEGLSGCVREETEHHDDGIGVR